MQFSPIWPIDRTLSDATSPGQKELENDGQEGVLKILQSSAITGTSPSNCLVSYRGHSLWGYYSLAEMQLVYSTAPVLYSHPQHHNDTIIKQTQGQRRKKTSFQIYLPLILLQGFERVVQGFACERVLVETEHKLHILTPLLWPSRCVLFSWCWGPLHRGFSEGPLGRVWPSLPHLVSNSLGVYWQLLWHPKLNWVK